MAELKIKQVGKPDITKGSKDIYHIYLGSKRVGTANYFPSAYKSKYSVSVVTSSMKGLKEYYRGDAGKNISVGNAAKNQTNVLKVFKAGWTRLQNNIKKKNQQSAARKRTLKKTGLTSEQLNHVRSIEREIKGFQERIKENQYKQKVAKQQHEHATWYVKSYRKQIADAKKTIALYKSNAKK